MAKTPETISYLVPQEFRVIRKGIFEDIRVSIDEFKLPKELVFRDDASFLSPAEQDIIQGVIEGDSNKQIALKRKMSLQTVKNQITNIANRLREEGSNIPYRTGGGVRLNIILALLRMKELELRDP